MKFLVHVPPSGKLEGQAVVATGSGLSWSATPILMTSLLEDARRQTIFENVRLRDRLDMQMNPQRYEADEAKFKKPTKSTLVYGERDGRLLIHTEPFSPSRFIGGLVAVVQDIRDSADRSLGYVVVFPDCRVVRVTTDELLAQCELCKHKGTYFVQNMQYVGDSGMKAAHLKNYEGCKVPVYTVQIATDKKPVPAGTAKTVLNKETILVLSVPPEAVLDSDTVVVEKISQITEDSVKQTFDKSVNLLIDRLGNTELRYFTDAQKRMIRNYIRFVCQFKNRPEITLYGLHRLLNNRGPITGYLCSPEFHANQKETSSMIADAARKLAERK